MKLDPITRTFGAMNVALLRSFFETKKLLAFPITIQKVISMY
jgi:hypothetical protein